MTEDEKPETITTTIEINRELFLRFKAICVLKELTLSGEIEKMISDWVGREEKEHFKK